MSLVVKQNMPTRSFYGLGGCGCALGATIPDPSEFALPGGPPSWYANIPASYFTSSGGAWYERVNWTKLIENLEKGTDAALRILDKIAVRNTARQVWEAQGQGLATMPVWVWGIGALLLAVLIFKR